MYTAQHRRSTPAALLLYLPLLLFLPTIAFSLLYLYLDTPELSALFRHILLGLSLLWNIIFTASFFYSLSLSFFLRRAAGFYILTAFWGPSFVLAFLDAIKLSTIARSFLLRLLYISLSNAPAFLFAALSGGILLAGALLYSRALKADPTLAAWMVPLLRTPVFVSILYSFSALISHMEPAQSLDPEVTPLSLYSDIYALEALYVLLWLGTLCIGYKLGSVQALRRYLLYWGMPVLLSLIAIPLSLIFSSPVTVKSVAETLPLLTTILFPLCVFTYPFFTLFYTYPGVYFLLLPGMLLPGILVWRQLLKKCPGTRLLPPRHPSTSASTLHDNEA